MSISMIDTIRAEYPPDDRLPFDIAAAIMATATVENPTHDPSAGNINENGTVDVGVLQVNSGTWPDIANASTGATADEQVALVHPIVDDAVVAVLSMRSAFQRRVSFLGFGGAPQGENPVTVYDPRDEVKWFDLVWNIGAPRAGSWSEVGTTTDPAVSFPWKDTKTRNAHIKRQARYLAEYNRFEHKEPFVNQVRDALAAIARGAGRGAGEGFGSRIGAAEEFAVAGETVMLLASLVFLAYYLNRRKHK